MIVSSDLESAFGQARPYLESLKQVVDGLLVSLASGLGGKYEGSRIKPLESLTAKIEKDHPAFPFREIDDLLAATVTFPVRQKFGELERKIGEFCDIEDRKTARQKEPDRFSYDDFHLILRLKQDHSAVIQNPVLAQFKFELQMKTHLQFALSMWSRNTYKTATLSWEMDRLISQTRALVEMADSVLARSGESADEKPEFSQHVRRNEIIETIRSSLPAEQLPEDMRRLAVTVEQYLDTIQSDHAQKIELLKCLLDEPSNKDIVSSESLTAYNVVLIALFRKGLIAHKENSPGGKWRLKKLKNVLVTSEMLSFCPELKDLAPEHKVDLSIPDISTISAPDR